jgi:hypothetical protein
MKKHLSIIPALALLATPATADALKSAALTAQKCSLDFIRASVFHGDFDPSIDIAAASLEYCTAAWQEVAVLEFPELAQNEALGLVKRAALEPLTFDVFRTKDHLTGAIHVSPARVSRPRDE